MAIRKDFDANFQFLPEAALVEKTGGEEQGVSFLQAWLFEDQKANQAVQSPFQLGGGFTYFFYFHPEPWGR